MNSNKNQTKKKTLLDDFNEIEEYSKKQNYDTHFESELSESNTINADTESISKFNQSRQHENEFDDISSANQYGQLKNLQKKNAGINKIQAVSGVGSQIGGRNHVPQIIDEDTEHFKVKIEHLLNVFKTDAISEFMGMKRSMLEDQRSQVKNQTERYLSMYEDKHKEQTETKDKLEEQIRINGVLKERLEKMSTITQKAKSRFHIQKSLQYFFAAIKNYKKLKVEQKKKKKLAEIVAAKNLKQRVFSSFYRVFIENKHASDLEKKEKYHLTEIDEITNRFNKEMAQLKEQLIETQQQLQQIHQNKESMQENLKKAFMRGVCALNFEAMNAIQGTNQGFNPDQFINQIENPQQTSNLSMKNISQTPSTFSQSYVPSNVSHQQPQLIQQQQLQQYTQNENNLMQSVVQKNPQSYNSAVINTVETNPNLIQPQQQIQPLQQFLNNTNLQQNSSQFNPSQAHFELEQERISQIEFLKKELEQIQKIAGNLPNMIQNQYSQRQDLDQIDRFNSSTKNFMEQEDSPQQKIVIFQETKLESKEHKWKNAPVVGISNKQVNNNKENQEFLQNTSSLPNFLDQQQNYTQEDECKVIRVNTSSKEFQSTAKFDKASLKPNAKPPAKEPMPQKQLPSTSSNLAQSKALNNPQTQKSISNNATVKSSIGTPSKAVTKTTTKK